MIRLSDVSEVGYAKINLHLDVTGILEDGYHGVNTVMQTVSLYDTVRIYDIEKSEDSSSFFISCDKEGVPCDERNLAVKAARLFCEYVGMALNVRIDIKKNIPMAAGMAGGSADGAAVLRGLNRALGEPLSTDELCALGSRLGADVPFCIVGGTAYADGRGDVLHAFPKMPECYLVVCCEGEGVSTPWAYRLLDEKYRRFSEDSGYTPKDIAALKNAMERSCLMETVKELYNIFEAPVLAERPVAADVKQTLLDEGALGAMMSGSGPSVFGVFEDRERAEVAVAALEKKGFCPYLCTTV